MLSGISIRNLRSLASLDMPELGRVTILTGKNGSGKTTVLEGLFLLSGPGNPSLSIPIAAYRELSNATELDPTKGGQELWDSLFPHYDFKSTIHLAGAWNGQRQSVTIRAGSGPQQVTINGADQTSTTLPSNIPSRQLQVFIGDDLAHPFSLRIAPPVSTVEPTPPTPPYVALYQPSRLGLGPKDIERFGDLVRRREDKPVLDAVRVIDPRVRGIQAIPSGGVLRVFAEVGLGPLIPLNVMGDGALRVFWLATNLTFVPNGLLLVDEFENGIHYSAMVDVWRVVNQLSQRLNVQIVATTHSRECIQAAYEAFTSRLLPDDKDLRVIRLERDGKGVVRASTYDKEALEGALHGGLEVR